MVGKSHLICGSCVLADLYTATLLLERRMSENSFLYSEKFNPTTIKNYFLLNNEGKFDIGFILLGLGLFLIGSLLPDIDNKNSTLGKYFHLPLKHRGFTHQIYPILLISLSALFFNKAFAYLALGYFIHLFLDSFSTAGICWFKDNFIRYSSGAFVKKNHKLKLYRAGDVSEYVVDTVIVILSFVFVFYNNWIFKI